MTTIYALKDPNTLEIKYVGKTGTDPEKRLLGHISYALRKNHLLGKHQWLRDLRNNRQLPIIDILEECFDEVWQEREKYWISELQKTSKLFNKTEGGEDFVFKSGNNPWNKGGAYYSPETRAKMSIAKKGKPLTEECKAKMSLVRQGRGFSAENHQKSIDTISKRILEYSLEGKFIREWKSATEAGRFYGIQHTSIGMCCRGKVKVSCEKVFKFYTPDYPLEIKVDLYMKRIYIGIELYNIEDQLLQTFKCIRECAEWLIKNDSIFKDRPYLGLTCLIREYYHKNKPYKDYKFKLITK